jgi:tetratricopeptide (TPR) repeat protein
MRTGEFRICAQCQARNKATQAHCVQCGRGLFSIPLSRSGPELSPEATDGSRTTWIIIAGLVLACAVGFLVRRTLRGASWEQTAVAAPAAAPEPALTATAVAVPPPPTARDFEKGRALLDRGDARGALRLLTPIAQAEPDNAFVAFAYGRALWASGSRDRAILQFERAARIDPRTPAYRVELAKSLAASRRVREAIREYEAAVSLDPGSADNVLALAALYSRAGDNAESRALLQRAAVLRPGDVDIERRLAELDARETGSASSSTATSYAPSAVAAPDAPSAVPAPSSAGSTSPPVYTADDLRRAGSGRTPGAVPPQPPPPVVRSSSSQLGEDEASWRAKVVDRREGVRAAEQRFAATKAHLDLLQRQAGGQSPPDDTLEHDLAKAQDDLDSAQERLAKAQRRMEELHDEARRKGIPPEWLR